MKANRQPLGGFLFGFLFLLPVLAVAQSSTPVPRIGYLAWASCEPPSGVSSHLLAGLRDLGYQPGETILIECRSAGRHDNGLVPAAAQLVEAGVDVIVSTSQPAARAAHKVTRTIPIVSIISGDPVASGMARSLARPGGNLTGLTYYATELTGKRLQLLKQALPHLESVDVLANPIASYLPFEQDIRIAADRLGLELKIHHVKEPADIDTAFASMKPEQAQAVFILPDMMLAHEAGRIAKLALEHRMPTFAWGDWYANAGCLLTYSAWYPDLSYRLAFYVDQILKGAKPGDLPIEQPAKFVLSVNLKTAEALDIEIPRELLLITDNIVE